VTAIDATHPVSDSYVIKQDELD